MGASYFCIDCQDSLVDDKNGVCENCRLYRYLNFDISRQLSNSLREFISEESIDPWKQKSSGIQTTVQ